MFEHGKLFAVKDDWRKERKMKQQTKDWIKAAAIRALKTGAQAAIAVISVSAVVQGVDWAAQMSMVVQEVDWWAVGMSTVVQEVDWTVCAGTAAAAAILSLLTSIAGLPELKTESKQKEVV
jgi:hypothetical protein